MERNPTPAAALSPRTRELAEALLEQVDLAVGHCRLELVCHDGRLEFAVLHRKVGAGALARYDRQAAT